MDTESGKKDILLKVVNKSRVGESVDITLNRADNVDPLGHSTTLAGTPSAENSLANPSNVIPSPGRFAAGKRFKYVFPAYSVTVLRIGCSR
jgi:alpha-L-arabinofuranosidase